MAYKTLLFGTDDLFENLKPYYLEAAKQGILEIVAAAVIENGKVRFVTDNIEHKGLNSIDIDIAIISSNNNFYERMKQLEKMSIPRDRIIDGRVFWVPNLDFSRLLNEGVAYGFLADRFTVLTNIYPKNFKVVKGEEVLITVGTKTYINGGRTVGKGALSIGKFCSVSSNVTFELAQNIDHNYRTVSIFGQRALDWVAPVEFLPPQGQCKILIGNDVWVGIGAFIKCTNPQKPLVIGDGAVIASDSVIVKDVPPYAIVGGNPAQVIKYRFPPHVIKALLRIKWWDWSLDKIHDNFKYFNDVEKFISLHDK